MARRTVILATFLLAACRDQANRDGPRTAFDANTAMGYIRAQLDFGPRIPGTEGAARAGDWIVARMRERADTVWEQRWTHVTAQGVSLPMRNIVARFRPELEQRVLYVAHWDTRPVSDGTLDTALRKLPVPGANDGASGVALLIALGDVIAATPPSVGVDLLFTDGEDYGSFSRDEDVLIGARYFAEHLPAPGYRPLFGVLWDMIGDADLTLYQEGHSVSQAPEVVARVWEQAAELGYGSIFVPQQMGGVTDDHLPLLAKGLRVIDVIDIAYPPHHTPHDTYDKVSARSMQVVGDVATALVTR